VSHRSLEALGLALSVLAGELALLRWLRVAQREHYLPGSVVRFAKRWWVAGVGNRAAFLLGAVGAVVSAWFAPAAFASVIAAGAGPAGLGLRGRTSKLAWTPRLRRLALATGALSGLVVGLPSLAGLHAALTAAALWAMGAPLLAEAALELTRPLEARLLAPYVERARRRLTAVAPRVVAITGSYGKTTTKGYVAHLSGGTYSVVASPASFNNTAGLARAVNEHLASGTQVFVAEMGTYGPGEIRSMCRWAHPEIAVITSIGPVHLERMRSLEQIAEAKAEILTEAQVAVLNIDYPLLEELAQKIEEEGRALWRCSSDQPRADVKVAPEEGKLRVRAKHLRAELDALVAAGPEVEPGNVACAVAAALALGVPSEVVAARLASLPGAPHRRSLHRSSRGAAVIDDTYNANPSGARAALRLLAKLGAKTGKKVVVTPGIIELGPAQPRENANFAASAGEVATEMLIVGRTNARSLAAGARAARLTARRLRNRRAAVAWVSAHLGEGDAVLYENDLPDHYP